MVTPSNDCSSSVANKVTDVQLQQIPSVGRVLVGKGSTGLKRIDGATLSRDLTVLTLNTNETLKAMPSRETVE
jgi:hypothetical protein